ncbi:MAG: HD domain-containing protein [Oligoflexia bacterium]|nr:HD domain-containing protein [Oligoflexia bacterium]
MTQQIHHGTIADPLWPENSPLVQRARESAITCFAGVTRKVPRNSDFIPEPYFAHLERVAATLRSLGYSDAVIAAAYLHDHTEDLDDWDLERIKDEFGAEVAELVRNVSFDDTSRPWLERRYELLAKWQAASPEALAIGCADQLDNMQSTIRWLKLGFRVEDLMDHSFSDYLDWYKRYGEVFRARLGGNLPEEFDAVLAEYEALGSGTDLG